MPELHLTRRQILVAAVVAVLLLAAAGRLLLRSVPAQSAPAPALVAPTTTASAASIVVDVVGAVRRPGLYRLREGARIADAVGRAGGTTSKAQLELVNVAAPLADGEQVVVPRRGEVTVNAAGAPGATPATAPVHLNSATLEQLDTLPGVGPVTAQKIVDYRAQHGPFTSLEELDAIPGIGPARLEQLKGLAVP
jgi:competence protein ComEA